MIEAFESKGLLKYDYFDLHHIKSHTDTIEEVQEKLKKKDTISAIYRTAKSVGRTGKFDTPTTVLRVNCLDCLDRTNVAQNFFSKIFFT